MPVILDILPQETYRLIMNSELEDRLQGLGEVIHCHNAEELAEDEYGQFWEQADAVLSGWGVRPPTNGILDRAFRLKIIGHAAGTVRMFPRYALEKGIVITSARVVMARTVAEYCLMSALVMLRRFPGYLDVGPQRRDFFMSEHQSTYGIPHNRTLCDKTVGLIGFGCIGRIFRALLAPFRCRVVVYDPYVSRDDAAQFGVELVDLGALLRQSLVVSLHAPDIPSTYRLLGKPELDQLQDGAIFINSARGRLVDTAALTSTLSSGRFCAAIDVTDPEPLAQDHPLRRLPNVVLTPHVAGPTEDDLTSLTSAALGDIKRTLLGEAPLHPISLQTYDIMSMT